VGFTGGGPIRIDMMQYGHISRFLTSIQYVMEILWRATGQLAKIGKKKRRPFGPHSFSQ
jgi:hypothetical protein